MKTLFVLASVLVVLLAATATIIPVEANKIEAQTGVSGLEARVAKLEKRLAAVEAQLARIVATPSGVPQAQPGQRRHPSSDNGTRFIGNWNFGGQYGEYLSISKDGGKYIVRYKNQGGSGVVVCELSNGSLKNDVSNIDFIESSGHITWRGMELQKLP